MMRKQSLYMIAIKIILITFIVSCSSYAKLSRQSPLPLKDRTLHIDPANGDLIYPYEKYVCKNPEARIFKNCKWKQIIERYDLKNEKIRLMLINQGFRVISKFRFSDFKEIKK